MAGPIAIVSALILFWLGFRIIVKYTNQHRSEGLPEATSRLRLQAPARRLRVVSVHASSMRFERPCHMLLMRW